MHTAKCAGMRMCVNMEKRLQDVIVHGWFLIWLSFLYGWIQDQPWPNTVCSNELVCTRGEPFAHVTNRPVIRVDAFALTYLACLTPTAAIFSFPIDANSYRLEW